jgi:hypothetical protein
LDLLCAYKDLAHWLYAAKVHTHQVNCLENEAEPDGRASSSQPVAQLLSILDVRVFVSFFSVSTAF